MFRTVKYLARTRFYCTLLRFFRLDAKMIKLNAPLLANDPLVLPNDEGKELYEFTQQEQPTGLRDVDTPTSPSLPPEEIPLEEIYPRRPGEPPIQINEPVKSNPANVVKDKICKCTCTCKSISIGRCNNKNGEDDIDIDNDDDNETADHNTKLQENNEDEAAARFACLCAVIFQWKCCVHLDK
eukprot:m.338732 g.338732  ORF g.338732 m.338732 type:complete len:183 (+) comp18529_c0_seq1:74-622(+)